MAKQQQLTTIYQQGAGSSRSTNDNPAPLRDIPDYQSAGPEVRAMIDTIISAFDVNDADAGVNFGDDVLEQRNRIAEQIIGAQSAERFSFIREPLQGAADFMREGGFQELLDNAARVVSKGGAIAKRNPLLIAGAVGLSLISAPVALVAGATAITIKEKARKLKQRGTPKSADELEAELRESIASFAPMLRNLGTAKAQIPAVRAETNALGKSNLQVAATLPLYIAAGREILRRIHEEEIQNAEQSGDADKVRILVDNAEHLGQKISILSMARLGAIRDVTVLANLVQIFADLEMNITSIVSHEANVHRANLAAQGTSLEALRLANLLTEFREKAESGATLSIQATERARKLVSAGRIDSPERLQAFLSQMHELQQNLEGAIRAIPTEQSQKIALQRQVEEAAGRVVDAQIAYAAATSRGQHSLPGVSGPTNTPRLG